MNRREFLKLSFWIAARVALPISDLGCSILPPRPDIRRTEGVWSREDVEQAGRSMMSSEEFRFIAGAGKLLYGNQQGEKTISSWSDLFTNQPIEIQNVVIEEKINDHTTPADALVEQNYPPSLVTLKGLNNNPDLNLVGGNSLRLSQIRLHKNWMEGKSDFLLKLILAKEIYTITVADLATRVLLPEIYNDYELPDDEMAIKVMRVASILRSLPDGTPLRWIIDFWGHFALIPDYLLAKDLGKLQGKAQEGMFIFDTSSKLFREMGILTREDNGKYYWTGGNQQLIQAWYRMAWSGYKSLIEQAPSSR